MTVPKPANDNPDWVDYSVAYAADLVKRALRLDAEMREITALASGEPPHEFTGDLAALDPSGMLPFVETFLARHAVNEQLFKAALIRLSVAMSSGDVPEHIIRAVCRPKTIPEPPQGTPEHLVWQAMHEAADRLTLDIGKGTA